MLGERVLGIFGRYVLWSVNRPNEGPAGMELGSVKTKVMTANAAIVASNMAILRGCNGRIGRPKKVC